MSRDERRRMTRDLAAESGVPLYRRYGEAEAADIVGVSPADMRQLRQSGKIAFLRLTNEKVGYFGFQLLDYLLDAITRGTEAASEPAPAPTPTAPPDALLLSVPDAAARLGISRSKLYELISDGQLETMHIGRRALVRAESIERFIAARR